MGVRCHEASSRTVWARLQSPCRRTHAPSATTRRPTRASSIRHPVPHRPSGTHIFTELRVGYRMPEGRDVGRGGGVNGLPVVSRPHPYSRLTLRGPPRYTCHGYGAIDLDGVSPIVPSNVLQLLYTLLFPSCVLLRCASGWNCPVRPRFQS